MKLDDIHPLEISDYCLYFFKKAKGYIDRNVSITMKKKRID